MNKIPTFEKFSHDSFIKETYHLVEGYISYNEYQELIGESFFKLNFIKDLFTNPLQKRNLDKLGQDLLKTKIELMKLEIEEDSIDSFKSQLNQMKRGDLDYDDQYVYWKGKKYSRAKMDEGNAKLPWEDEAYRNA